MFATLRVLASRIRRWLSPLGVDEEFKQELDSHLAMLTEENLRRGMSPEEANRAARLRLGGMTQLRCAHRELHGLPFLDTLFQDIRYAFRTLRLNRGFTMVTVFTLALGIGVNTAIFSVIDAALLRPLPYDRPEQLVDISMLRTNGNDVVIAPDFKIWQEQSKVFEAIGAFGLGFNGYSQGANLTGLAELARVRVVPVTVGFFRLLGVQPIAGRDFRADEGQAGHNQVALVSASVWRREFGGAGSVLNKTIYLDSTPYTIVGVMPAGLLYPPGDLWVPEVLDASNSLPQSADWPMLYVVGRLKPGVSLAQARAELQVLSHGLLAQFSPGRGRAHSRWQVEIVSLRQLLAGDAGHLLFILLAAVGFILLIACANLANLSLARAAARSREVAVRAALGAARWRLVRQFLAESVLLASLGGGLGLPMGLWAESAMKNLVPPELPSDAGLDWRILAFVMCISACAVILFGLTPALMASRVDVNGVLKEGGTHAGLGPRTHRLRGLLVIAETALTLILLTGAGLLARSFVRLSDVSLGFDPHHVLLADLYLPVTEIDQPQRQVNFFRETLERIRATPGVESAAATTHYPVSIFNSLATNVTVSGASSAPSDKPVSVAFISPGYFRTMGIPLLQGRDFTGQDASGAQEVVILSDSESRSAFPGGDAVGKEVSLNGPKGPWRLVVGVAADTRNYMLDREPWPEIFVPYPQNPSLYVAFVLRTAGDPMRFATTLQEAVRTVDRNQPVSHIEPMDHVVQKVLAPPRFKVTLLGSFALLALALGAIGIYGVISYAVTERTHEIGVRVVLGAQSDHVLRMVVGQGFRLVLIGTGIGITGALALTGFLANLLYGVRPTDPLTFVAVSLLLAGVSLLASYIPARRAMRVDPMVALR